jgi:hypothetical protein
LRISCQKSGAEKAAAAAHKEMKPIRYIVATIGFLLVWLVVAIVIGIIMILIFSVPGDRLPVVGIGGDWRNIPGTVLGLLAGIQSFRASVRASKKKDGL